MLAALFVASLALRPELIGVGPLLATIQHKLDISHSLAGLLSTLVVLCMGLFAPLALVVARRLGLRWTVATAITLIGAFGIIRSASGPAIGVLLLTLPIGIGTAIAGTLMPVVVGEAWPGRPVLATAVYAAGVSLGAAVSSGIAVPLSQLLGGWRGALQAFGVFIVLAAVGWLILSAGFRASGTVRVKPSGQPLRSWTGWMLVGLFAMVEITFFGINAWLPASFAERGWTGSSAGALLTVVNGVTVPASLLLASYGDRFGSRRYWLGLGASLQLGGLLGVLVAPGGGWIWAATIGVANGILFPSMMVLPIDVAHSPGDVASMAASMLGGGLTVAAFGPFFLGLLRDTTGSFSAAMWFIFGLTALILSIVVLNPHQRLRRPPRRPQLEDTAGRDLGCSG